MNAADRTYRTAVLLFAVLMIVGSAVLMATFAFSELPITYCPFIKHEPTQGAVLGGVAAVQLIFAVGLLVKSRIAWNAFFVYLGLGTVFEILALIFDPPRQSGGLESGVFAIFALLVNGLIAAFLNFIRSVFQARP